MNEQESLSIIDAAWLRMDRPTNLMMICGMMMFADRVELQKLKEVVRTRMLCFHRFRQRVVEQDGNAHWEIDPHFDLDWHVRRIALPDAGRGGALEAVTSDLISTPLDPSKPTLAVPPDRQREWRQRHRDADSSLLWRWIRIDACRDFDDRHRP